MALNNYKNKAWRIIGINVEKLQKDVLNSFLKLFIEAFFELSLSCVLYVNFQIMFSADW